MESEKRKRKGLFTIVCLYGFRWASRTFHSITYLNISLCFFMYIHNKYDVLWITFGNFASLFQLYLTLFWISKHFFYINNHTKIIESRHQLNVLSTSAIFRSR